MKAIEVVAAIVVNDGKTLCAQRSKDKLDYLSEKSEFPGGKLESDEMLEQALAWEMREELDMTISVDRLLLTVEHVYPDFKIIMHSFICYTQSRVLLLNEHLQAFWLGVNEINVLDCAAADLPIVDQLKATM